MNRLPRAEVILPMAILFGAALLIASEFMVTFELTAGGEPQDQQTAADRHSYSLVMLALFAVAGMLVAVTTGRRGAAFATAAFGVAALLLFLLLDLPEAGNTGTVEGDDGSAVFFATAKAEPQIGFWLEAIGSLTLGLAAIAFATLRSEQLRAPARLLAGRRERRGAEREERAETQTRRTEAAPAHGAPKPTPAKAERPTATKPASRPKRAKGDAVVPFDMKASHEGADADASSNGRRGFLARLRSTNR